jgi:hypothetical protein
LKETFEVVDGRDADRCGNVAFASGSLRSILEKAVSNGSLFPQTKAMLH